MTLYTEIDTPIGQLLLVTDEEGLREIRFENDRKGRTPEPDWERDPVVFQNSNHAQSNDMEERTLGNLPEWQGAWSLVLLDAQNRAGWII